MIMTHCKEHNYIIVEAEGDDAGSWHAHMLCCSKCLHLILYKDILKLNKAKQVVDDYIIDV